jgi:hypothetical protein
MMKLNHRVTALCLDALSQTLETLHMLIVVGA